jgi:ATP-dependent helicase HrpB
MGGEFLVAVDLLARDPFRASGAGARRSRDADAEEPRIRMASLVDREWLQPNGIDLEHRFDAGAGVVRAVEVERYDALVIRERPASPDPEETARLLAEAWIARGPSDEDAQLIRRVRFAGHDLDLPGCVATAASTARRLAEIDLTRALSPDVLRTLDARAPRALKLPSGRAVRLDYLDDGRVSASVKLQDAFGLVDSPRLGPRGGAGAARAAARAGALRPARAERTTRAAHDRSPELLDADLPGRAAGTARPVSEAPMARRPVHGFAKMTNHLSSKRLISSTGLSPACAIIAVTCS